MPDIKEKLVELLKNNREHYLATYSKHLKSYEEYTADHLIANGVTIQRWISVEERLPEDGKIVLAFGKRHATSGQFRGTGRKPNLWIWRGNMYKDVTHWMPLPEPPKGEEQ